MHWNQKWCENTAAKEGKKRSKEHSQIALSEKRAEWLKGGVGRCWREGCERAGGQGVGMP